MNKYLLPVLLFLLITMSYARAETVQETLNKGNGLFEQGNYEKAIICFDKVLATDPKSEVAWFRKGISLYKLKKYEEASLCFDELIKINSGTSDIWYFKGLTLYKQGKYNEAIAYFDKVLEVAPGSIYSENNVGADYVSPWNTRGMALFMIENYDESLKSFDKALAISPDLAIAWHNKGESLKKLGKYKEAEECSKKEKNLLTDKQKPERSQTSDEWFMKGYEYFKKGIWSQALEWFNKALENNANHGLSLFYIGMVYNSKKDYPKALENMDKAMKLVESSKDISGLKPALVYSGKALVLLKVNKYYEAKDFADKAIKADPNSPDHYFTKGITLCYLKDFKEAVKCIDKTLELDPKCIEAWYYKSMISYGQGNQEESMKFCNKALEMDPKFADALYQKGLILYHQGKYNDAKTCYDKAVKLSPDENYVWYNYEK
jgi:tetratricopeptide (TPR) repeat protein